MNNALNQKIESSEQASVAAGPTQNELRNVNIQLRATLARAAIQAYLFLNGGAAVALLAFLGNLATAPETRAS